MKAIVTGADGFIGSSVTRELLAHGCEVLAVDRSPNPRRLNLKLPGLIYRQCDCEQIESLIPEFGNKYDVFYHFAWAGPSGDDRKDFRLQLANVGVFLNIIVSASKLGCKKIVFASSIIELEANALAYTNGASPDSHYIYGGAKASCRLMGKPLADSLGIDLVWANIASVYGVGDRSGGFINSTLTKILKKEELDFTKGEQCCDFVYIDDVAAAFRLLGLYGKANCAYLIGSGYPCSVRDYVLQILNTLSVSDEPHFGTVPFSGFPWQASMFSIADIVKDCQYTPKVSFAEGVKKTFKWLQSQN